MSVFGPVDDGDRRIWQIQAVDTLSGLLGEAHKAQLAPLTWTVHTTGLKGRVAADGTAAEQQAVFEAWVKLLGGPEVRERADSFTLRLWASAKYGRHRADVVVWADISLTPGDEP